MMRGPLSPLPNSLFRPTLPSTAKVDNVAEAQKAAAAANAVVAQAWAAQAHHGGWGAQAHAQAQGEAPDLQRSPSATLPLSDGHTLKLLREIGAGGFGTVYAARATHVDGFVAVKMVGHGGDSEELADIAREVAVHERLFCTSPDHSALRHLIRLHAHYTQPARSLLLLEMCSASIELEDFVQRQPCASRLDEDRARPLASALVEALAFCHAVGVVHLDITPRNALVNPVTLSLKLIDYGSGTILEDEQASGCAYGYVAEHGGTEAYRSPERLLLERAGFVQTEMHEMGGRFLGPPADVFSLGCTYFFMLTGRDAWDYGEDDAAQDEVLGQIQLGEVPFWRAVGAAGAPSLTAEVRALVSSMLAYSPLERPSMAQLQRHPWFTRGAGPVVTDPAAVEPPAPPASPTKAVAEAVAALAM